MSSAPRHLMLVALLLALVGLPGRASAAIEGAVHQGTATSDSIRWDSRVVFDALPTRDLDPIVLPGVREVSAVNNLKGPFRAELRQGQVSLVVEPDQELFFGELTWTTTQPLDPDAPVRLRPPLLAQAPMQIVDVTRFEGRTFRPSLGPSLDMRVGYYADPSLRPGEHEGWDRALHFEPRASRSTTVYLRNARSFDDGIAGELGPASNIARVGWGWAGLVLAATLGVSWLTYRRLARKARIERAEADLEDEFRTLDGQPARREP